MVKCKGKIEIEKLKKIINQDTIINGKLAHSFKNDVQKNNIWFSKYNFYICGKSGTLFLILLQKNKQKYMFWTLELASHLEEAPWPATKDELIDYAIRSGAPIEVVENLQELEDEGADIYESLEDIWPDYPSQEDFFFNEDEY
jgi:hypothetical protein